MPKQHIATMKKQNIDSFRKITGAATLAVLAGLAPVNAQDAKPEDKGWESTAGAGVSLSRGNTKNFLATINVDSKRKWAKDEALLGAKAGYGATSKPSPGEPDEDTTRTEGYVKGFGQFNHLFTERLYGALRVDAINDDIADIAYRISIAPLGGYYFIKTASTTLSADIGPTWIVERLQPVSTDTDGDTGARGYLGLRAGERFEHKFEGGARIWQTFDITPEVENWENYVVNFTVGASAPITKALSMQVVADDTYDHQPAPGRLKNDFKLTAGLNYKF